MVSAVDGGRVGDYALHLQCPWRVVSLGGVITRMEDLWEPANVDDWGENWHHCYRVRLTSSSWFPLALPFSGPTTANGHWEKYLAVALPYQREETTARSAKLATDM